MDIIASGDEVFYCARIFGSQGTYGWAVFKVINGKAHKTILNVEARGGAFASITEGLQENDEVILFLGEGIKEGSKI